MYFKIRGSVPILVYELVRCPVRFGMSPETLSIFIYPTGRFYHALRYFRLFFLSLPVIYHRTQKKIRKNSQ